MSSKAYSLDDFRDPEAEIARLRRQAQVVRCAEHDAFGALAFPVDGIALDVGCGPGAFAAGLLERFPELRLMGLDVERRSLERGAGVMPLLVADARAMPFRDACVDAAFARLVLRYVADPGRALREMRRVVRVGGVVLVEDADHAALEVHPEVPGLHDVLAARHLSMRRRGCDPHIASHALQMLSDAGLEDVTISEVRVTSEWIGVVAFAALVLEPIAVAVDDDLVGASELGALRDAIARWTQADDARATTRVVFTSQARLSQEPRAKPAWAALAMTVTVAGIGDGGR